MTALRDRVSASVDRAWGESFAFAARKVAGTDVDLPRVDDTARPTFTATGVWDGPSKSDEPHARGSIQDDNAHAWNASRPSVTVSDANLAWRPQRGDRVTRIVTGEVYEVADVFSDGRGRTTISLTARKR